MAPTPSLTRLSHQEVVPSKGDTPTFPGHSLAPTVVQSDSFRSQRKRLVVTPQGRAASSQHSAFDPAADFKMTRATNRARLWARHGTRALTRGITAMLWAAERTLWLDVIKHSLRPHGGRVSNTNSQGIDLPGSNLCMPLKRPLNFLLLYSFISCSSEDSLKFNLVNLKWIKPIRQKQKEGRASNECRSPIHFWKAEVHRSVERRNRVGVSEVSRVFEDSRRGERVSLHTLNRHERLQTGTVSTFHSRW